MCPHRFGTAVGHVHDRDPLLVGKACQQLGELLAAVSVHHGGGLVGDEQARCPRECGGDRQPLQLSARQRRGFVVGELGEPDLRQQRLDIDRPATVSQAPHDVVADTHTQHL